MQNIPKSEVINSGLSALQKEQDNLYKAAQRNYTKAVTDIAELKAEVIKAIRGQSKFTPELLSEIIAESVKELVEIEFVRNTAKQELENCMSRMEEMQLKYDEVISWIDLYDSADHSAKKISRESWGKGVISTCIAPVTEFGFLHLKLERIYTTVHPDNIGSWKALEKNGFIREGLLRHSFNLKSGLTDCYIYSKLPTD